MCALRTPHEPLVVPDIGHTIIFTGVPSQIYIFPFLRVFFGFSQWCITRQFQAVTYVTQPNIGCQYLVLFVLEWHNWERSFVWWLVSIVFTNDTKSTICWRASPNVKLMGDFSSTTGLDVQTFQTKNSDLNFEVKTYPQIQNNSSQGCCKRTVNHSIISAPQVLQHILNIMKCSQYFWEVKRRGKLRLFWKLNVSIECHFNATQTRTRIPSPMMSTTKARNKVLGNKNFRPEPMKMLSVSFQ